MQGSGSQVAEVEDVKVVGSEGGGGSRVPDGTLDELRGERGERGVQGSAPNLAPEPAVGAVAGGRLTREEAAEGVGYFLFGIKRFGSESDGDVGRCLGLPPR